ncbi:flagellar motor switch phosphatase FliY [Virgibacillus ainsalahensis]
MMNDGKLSQDEIDALLKVTADEEMDGNQIDKQIEQLSESEQDALGEIGNISFGSSATTLSTLLNQRVEITTPRVAVIQKEDLEKEFTYEPVSIEVNYTDGFSGKNIFVIKTQDAAVISDIMLGGDGTSPDKELMDIHLSAVQEAMNQMMGAAATSMSTVFNKKVDISPPIIKNESSTRSVLDEGAYVKIFFNLRVGSLIDSNMIQMIPFTFAKQMADHLLIDSKSDELTANETAASIDEPIETTRTRIEKQQENEQEKDEQTTEAQHLGDMFDKNEATIQQATFSEFEQLELNKAKQRNLDMLLDIPLKVSVELGRTKQTIKEILDLSSGSIIELDKLAGEPVDILVNEKLIARGEVVVIDENFGVRVSDIVSQSDRLMKLK